MVHKQYFNMQTMAYWLQWLYFGDSRVRNNRPTIINFIVDTVCLHLFAVLPLLSLIVSAGPKSFIYERVQPRLEWKVSYQRERVHKGRL